MSTPIVSRDRAMLVLITALATIGDVDLAIEAAAQALCIPAEAVRDLVPELEEGAPC